MSFSEYVEHINELYESADDVGVPTNKNDGAPEEGAVYVNSAEAAGGAAGRMEAGRRGEEKGNGGADCEAKRVPAVSALYAKVQKKPRAEQGQGQQDTAQRQQKSGKVMCVCVCGVGGGWGGVCVCLCV